MEFIDVIYGDAKKYISQRREDKVMTFMDKCYEIDEKTDSNFDTFLSLIYNGKFTESLEYIDLFLTGKEEVPVNDAKIYLYLLSFLIELPQKYQELYKSYTYEDFKIYDEIEYKSLQNRIRYNLSEKKFLLAIQNCEDLELKRDKFDKKIYAVRKLANNVLIREMLKRQNIKNLCYSKNYEEIINILNHENKLHEPKMFDRYILILCNEIKRLVNEKTLSEKQPIETDVAFAAIDAKDYEKALEISLNYKINTKQMSKNLIDILLEQVVKLENAIKKEQKLNDEDIEWIDEIVNNVIEKEDFILLKPMKPERIEAIKNYLVTNLNVETLVVDNRLLIKYRNLNAIYFYHKAFIRNANEDFTNGRYEECVKKYKFFINNVSEPKAYIYYKLGMSYYRLYQKDEALHYLTMAQILNEREKNGKDVLTIIERIKGNEVDEEKPKIKLEEDVFKTEVYYGLNNAEEILNKLIEGTSLDEVAQEYELSNCDLNIIRLIVVRNLFTESRDTEAEAILKKVVRSEYKNADVKKFIDDINKNKKFYKNRKEEVEGPVLLRLK